MTTSILTKTMTKKVKTLTKTDSELDQTEFLEGTPRHRARGYALQGIYSWLIRGADGLQESTSIDAHIRAEPQFDTCDTEWYRTILFGVMRDSAPLQEQFKPFVERGINELSPIEHAVLLLGTYELMNHTEVPYRATINEAVELAKSFGGTDGFRFVNGVLDRVASVVRPAEFKKNQAKRAAKKKQ